MGVRSRTLEACNLSQCDHRFRVRQDFPALARIGNFLSVAKSFSCYVYSPPLSFDRCFWAPGFAGEASSGHLSSHAHSAVAFDGALVSLTTGAIVPGGAGGSVLVDGTGPSSRRGFLFMTPAPDLHLSSDKSRSGWGAHLLDHLMSGV